MQKQKFKQKQVVKIDLSYVLVRVTISKKSLLVIIITSYVGDTTHTATHCNTHCNALAMIIASYVGDSIPAHFAMDVECGCGCGSGCGCGCVCGCG